MQVGHACPGLHMLLPASQTAELLGMVKFVQDCSLRVVPQQQPAIRGGGGHMTSLWQDHHSPEGRLVTPEGLEEGAALEGCSRAHAAIPAVQASHSSCLAFALAAA